MYKILFIDEEQAAFDSFRDFIDDNQTEEIFQIITQVPLQKLDEMVQLIIDLNPDTVITDFRLNDLKTLIQYNVPYDGSELVHKFLSLKEGFPCFIMTSYDDSAMHETNDVNIVYVKDILHNNEKNSGTKVKFLKRIELQIEHYKNRIREAENKLLELINLRDLGKATIRDEEKIIELDTFLERTIDKRTFIPKEYKSLSNFKKLENLLIKADEILIKYQEKNDK
jgi:hypothetical protein